MVLLHSTLPYITLPWLYFILHSSILHYYRSTSLYLILLPSTIAVLHSTWLYIILPWLYFTLHDSTLLYHGCTSLYITLHHSIMPLLHSTLFSSLLHHGSTALYFALHHSSLALLHCTLLYHGSLHSRAAGSNLRMVRPSGQWWSNQLVAREARSKILDLAIFTARSQEALSLHFSFKLGA